MARLYTRVFLNTPLGLDELISMIASAFSGTVDRGTVTSTGCEMDVRKNENHSPKMLGRDPSDFIYFPYTIEIEPIRRTMSLDGYLAVVGKVMKSLARNGMQIVAACDWEDRLPGGGRMGM